MFIDRFGLRLVFWALLPATALLLGGCPSSYVAPANLPLIVGMEYAYSGLAGGMAEMRLPGVKFMPDIIGWDTMQSSADAAIDFGTLDRLVKEYQEAGAAECMIGLKSESAWASVAATATLPDTNFAPKPEYRDAYWNWVHSVVERYDGDGVNDMPGLKRPVRYYEIGVEFSSYEPESAADYIEMLEIAYQAAHTAYPDVIVGHAAFLVMTAFVDNPGPGEYEAAFASVDKRIMYHSLADIRTILDRPDVFDVVNFHTGAYWPDMESTIRWLRYEMDTRGYDKPLIISDTFPSSFAGWGPATVSEGNSQNLAIMMPPATEADRSRLAQYFTKLVNRDKTTVNWLHGYLAANMAAMVVVAAEQGIEFMNTTYMEDLVPLQSPLLCAAAGNCAWAGMVDFKLNWFTKEHVITGRRPMFYALKQLAANMDNYDLVERVPTTDSAVRLYRIHHSGDLGLPDFWIAWYDTAQLVLPGDTEPSTTLAFTTSAPQIRIETLITQPGQARANTSLITANGGVAEIPLDLTPVFINEPTD